MTTVALSDRLKGCDCPVPHTAGDGALAALLRTLRDAGLRPDEEVSLVALFVRSWIDMRRDGLWHDKFGREEAG